MFFCFMNNIPNVSLIGFMSNKVKIYGGVNLAQGIPGFDPPKELMGLLVDSAMRGFNQYAAGDGDAGLLERLRVIYGGRFSDEHCYMVTQGATEAVSLIYQYLCRKLGRFNSLAFEPVYESYRHIPAIHGNGFVSFNSLNGIDFVALERMLIDNKIRLMFINSPRNPDGLMISRADFDRLIDLSVCHDVYLLIDSVYEELYYDERPYIPFEKMGERVFYVNSFSKLLSITGWRVGYCVVHKSHFDELRYIHDYTGLCASSIAQRAIADYLLLYDYNDYVMRLRGWLRDNHGYVGLRLEGLGFEVQRSGGGYFVWAKLPDGIDNGFDFAVQLYDRERVAVVPGVHFSDNAVGYIRINIARPHDDLVSGIDGVERFLM